MESLAALFLAALPAELRAAEATPDLEPGLGAAWARGRDAHPGVTLATTAFAKSLGERRAEREVSWREIAAADFYLAVACLEGNEAALRTFERTVIAPLGKRLARTSRDAPLVEAAVRNVREAMFIGTDRRRPKLAVYTGQVPLAAWIAVVGKRELASLARKRSPERLVGAPHDLAHDPGDPELLALLRAHRGAFEQVIAKVMQELEGPDKDLLRWSVKDGATIDAIAPRLGIDRSTVARRLARIRDRVSAGVRAELRARLRLGTQTFDSLCAKMMPELDVSLSRIL